MKMKVYMKALLFVSSVALTACGGGSSGSPSLGGCPGNAGEVCMLDSISENGQTYLTAFKPAYLKINLGESVNFVSTDVGHDSKSRFTPEGAAPWHTSLSVSQPVTPDKEGVYIYYCVPHEVTGMFGIIQVGSAVNKDEAQAKVDEIIGNTLSSMPPKYAQRLQQAMQKVQ